MGRTVVILGGGTGGTLVANRLRRHLPATDEIVVIDSNDVHVYQPGLLFVPFGLAPAKRLVRSRLAQLAKGIAFTQGEVERVDVDDDAVMFANGMAVHYDVLIIASGASLLLDETEG